MLLDGINLVEGSKIVNLTVDYGASFPANPNVGELFYRSDEEKLYVYNGTGWTETSVDPSLPASQIAFGTGTAITSDAGFTFDPVTGSLNVSPSAVTSPGNITFTSTSPTSSGYAGTIILLGGNASNTAGSAGGNIEITSGSSGTTNGNTPGTINIIGGAAEPGSASPFGGTIDLYGGDATGSISDSGGRVGIWGGYGGGAGTYSDGGIVWIEGGEGGESAGAGGNVTVRGGIAHIGDGGSIGITAGLCDGTGFGGSVDITAGEGPDGGGNITLNSGSGAGEAPSPGQLIFKTGGNSSATVTDNGTYGLWEFEITPYVMTPEVDDANDLTHKQYVDDQDAFRVALAGDSMDSAANLTFSGGGEVIGLPATPSVATAAASKAYVDNIVSGSTTWRDPIECPNLQNIVSAIPTPIDRGSYIKFGGTQNETWGSVTNVVDNDIMEYTTSGGWERLGVLTAGHRFIIAGEVGTAGAGAITAEMRTMDLVEYVSGDANLAASWSKPHISNVQGIMFGVVQKTGASATGLTNDATVYNMTVRVNSTNYPVTVTGSAAQTFTNLITQINADLTGATASIVDGHIHITGANSTDTILISSGSSPDLLAALTDYSEVRGTVISGTTVLAQNPGCAEYGQTFLYAASNHDWIKISGPGSIQAGVGLAYDGNILNITLGAGIQELPSDEVGIDIYPSSGLMTTTDGTNSATTTNAQLSLTKTGVTGGTYKSVTVDVYGRVTAATNPTTVDGFGITDAAEINPGSPKDGDVQVSGSVISIYASGAWRQVFPAVYS